MKQDYIIFKGKRYNSGDTINILWHTNGYRNAHKYTGTFLDCDKEKEEYRFIVDGITYCFNKTCFYQTVCDKEDLNNTNDYIKYEPKKITFKDELNIDGMFVAWMWYIFIMLIVTIFKGNICFWILTSVVFFNYRNRKLKEAGYK